MYRQIEQVLKVLKMLTFLGAALLSIWGREKGKPNMGLNNYK